MVIERVSQALSVVFLQICCDEILHFFDQGRINILNAGFL